MTDSLLSCSRRIQFCYGHRLKDHEGACANLHGHNAVIWVHATSNQKNPLDSVGRVIDFSCLKKEIGGWIEQNWDHTTILYKEDQATIECLAKLVQKKPLYILPTNPTAENLAHYLLTEVCPKLLDPYGVKATQIEFYETENCKATASLL